MSGYSLILKIRRLEEECDKLGFMMCHSKYGHSREYGDIVAVKPKDQDSLPIYSRDAEFFTGSINELEVWLKGIQWARDYDGMLFGNMNKKRERKEQDYRNRQLLSVIKNTESMKENS